MNLPRLLVLLNPLSDDSPSQAIDIRIVPDHSVGEAYAGNIKCSVRKPT